MKKIKILALFLLMAAALLMACTALADDPIVAQMEVSPDKLAGPGTVTVTITISNSGDTDMKEPVYLYDPAAQPVTTFGTNGSVILKAGESKTWSGEYEVNSRTLESGTIVYFAKYTIQNDAGKSETKKLPIRGAIASQEAASGIEANRAISSTVAKEGDEITVVYTIKNTGTVSLKNVVIEETSDISKDKAKIEELPAGKTANVTFTTKMGKKNLTSGAVVTYTTETEKGTQTYQFKKQTITFGTPSLKATLESSAKGVVENGTVTLTLTLKNTGTMAYTDIQVTDPTLGDVFTNQELAAGQSLTLTKEVTVPETIAYCFTVSATDETGSTTSATTDEITITAISEDAALHMNVALSSDKTEIYSIPGDARFTIVIENDSKVDASDVTVYHGDTKLYTFATVKAGETKTLSRNFTLSMSGKYMITVTALDPLQNHQNYTSNELRIVLSNPTAAPATPTPVPSPTPVPTMPPMATAPSVNDPAIAPGAKSANGILSILAIVTGVLLAASCCLLAVAGVRRLIQKKASEAAVDQLERSERRDYAAPADDADIETASAAEPEQPAEPIEEEAYIPSAEYSNDTVSDAEPPHLKYAREARQAAEAAESADAQQTADYVTDYTVPAEEPAQEQQPEGTPERRRRRSEH